MWHQSQIWVLNWGAHLGHPSGWEPTLPAETPGLQATTQWALETREKALQKGSRAPTARPGKPGELIPGCALIAAMVDTLPFPLSWQEATINCQVWKPQEGDSVTILFYCHHPPSTLLLLLFVGLSLPKPHCFPLPPPVALENISGYEKLNCHCLTQRLGRFT